MWRFTQSRCVTRKEIASVIKLPSEDLKDILEQMSRIKVNHGWEFVFQHDYDFTDRYVEFTNDDFIICIEINEIRYQNVDILGLA